MEKLREGYTTGTCMAGAALASVIWQLTGKCPEKVQVDIPAGKTLILPVTEYRDYECGIKKDAGDDPDVTDGCIVKVKTKIYSYDGDIIFRNGEGVGTVTRKGLKVPPGEPAINPVPREMTRNTLEKYIGSRAAEVFVSVPGGREIAAKTFNPRLGITGGISILGTTGIVRPMSEEAVKESLVQELSMCRAEYGSKAAFVTGYSGEDALKKIKPDMKGIVLCSNYLGFLLDEALKLGLTDILIAGGAGKLVKPAADIMYLHSHSAGAQREIICTHAALHGLSSEVIRKIYGCVTTREMCRILKENDVFQDVMMSVVRAALKNCVLRTQGKINIAYMLIDENNEPMVSSENLEDMLMKWS